MTLITTVPEDILIHEIIYRLPWDSLKSFCCVSMVVKNLLDTLAKRTYIHRTLANKELAIVPGNLKKYCQYLQQCRIIVSKPNLFEQIEKARSVTFQSNGNPDKVKDLVRFGGTKTYPITPALVVFDYASEQIKANGPYGLGAALSVAICMDDEEMIEAIFLHPNVKNMKLDQNGIIDCLDKAIAAKNPEALKRILSLPETQKLNPNIGVDSLGSFLCKAVKSNDLSIVQAILSIPNVKHIQVRFLAQSLITAVQNDNADMVTMLLGLPNASKMDVSVLDSAIRKATGPNKNAIIDAIVNGTSVDKLALLQTALELHGS